MQAAERRQVVGGGMIYAVEEEDKRAKDGAQVTCDAWGLTREM